MLEPACINVKSDDKTEIGCVAFVGERQHDHPHYYRDNQAIDEPSCLISFRGCAFVVLSILLRDDQ